MSRHLKVSNKNILRQVVSLICLILLDFGSRHSRPNQGILGFPDVGDIISLIMFDLHTLAILSLCISLLCSESSWTFPPKNKLQWEFVKNRSHPPHLIHHHYYIQLAHLVDSSIVGPITNHPPGEKSQYIQIKLPFIYVSLLICIRFCAHLGLIYLRTWPLSYML